MKSRTARSFWRHYHSLPSEVQQLASKCFRLWRDNPRYPSLHCKKLRDGLISVRVSDSYRAVGRMLDDGVLWLWIGPHAEYDHVIKYL